MPHPAILPTKVLALRKATLTIKALALLKEVSPTKHSSHRSAADYSSCLLHVRVMKQLHLESRAKDSKKDFVATMTKVKENSKGAGLTQEDLKLHSN